VCEAMLFAVHQCLYGAVLPHRKKTGLS